MTTLLYTHAAFGAHEVPDGHVERQARYRAVETALAGDDFAGLDRREAPRARDKAGGRLVSLLEGGYDLDALARSVATHVKALMEG